jgi:hypothetical protein
MSSLKTVEKQGDQIGRNFRILGDCLLRAAFLKTTKSSPIFSAMYYISTVKVCNALLLTKNGLSPMYVHTLGDFIKNFGRFYQNSSGHPGRKHCRVTKLGKILPFLG